MANKYGKIIYDWHLIISTTLNNNDSNECNANPNTITLQIRQVIILFFIKHFYIILLKRTLLQCAIFAVLL